jgi:uncharacterized glyoxalase superfamily protein PhnB
MLPYAATDFYPVFVLRDLRPVVAFYRQWFGFDVAFESTWFTVLTTPGEAPRTIAFLTEDWPEKPKPPRLLPFSGAGSYLTLEVKDVAVLYEAATKAKLAISYPLTDEPWGQRRFGIVDPAGVFLDIVQFIPPRPGYWDRYQPKRD